jgi:hypothetical protein
MRTTPLAFAGMAVVAALGSAACSSGGANARVASLSGGSSRATSSTTVSKQGAQRLWNQFAACMRQHGVSMADPVLNKDGMPTNGVRINAGGSPQAAGVQAGQACRSQLQAAMKASGKSPSTPSPADQAKAEKYAKCMRTHGVPDFPDPQTTGGGGIQIKGGGPGSSDLNPDSPVFQKAQKVCAFLRPGKAGQGGLQVRP